MSRRPRRPSDEDLADALAKLGAVHAETSKGRRRCVRCQRLFYPDGPLDTVCRAECGEVPRRRVLAGRRPNRTMHELTCVECGSRFEANHSDAQFCSALCRKRRHRAMSRNKSAGGTRA
jgi:hypothetical protein